MINNAEFQSMGIKINCISSNPGNSELMYELHKIEDPKKNRWPDALDYEHLLDVLKFPGIKVGKTHENFILFTLRLNTVKE